MFFAGFCSLKVREELRVTSLEEPGSTESLEKIVLTLHHAGADLHDDWILTDIGLTSGSTIKVRILLHLLTVTLTL